MRLITTAEFEQFVCAKRAAAVHFDAEWDAGYRRATRVRMLAAERVLADVVNFGEVDVDKDLALAKSIPVSNVPLVAYYLDGQLVAALIGTAQNVLGRLERVLRGEPIGYKDGTTAAA
jgi:thioredoxin-like negative regulator of GroEL